MAAKNSLIAIKGNMKIAINLCEIIWQLMERRAKNQSIFTASETYATLVSVFPTSENVVCL